MQNTQSNTTSIDTDLRSKKEICFLNEFFKVQDCCSSFVVVTSFDHRSFLYCANPSVFYPCLVTCKSTSF